MLIEFNRIIGHWRTAVSVESQPVVLSLGQ
jgi:hypothetical protein